MLSKMSYSIEDLPVPGKALTESEASTVEGGFGPGVIWGIVGAVGSVVMVADALVNGENAWSSVVLSDAACKLTSCNK